ncbi:MAG TPA: hypothetical protein ACFYEM_09790 [Candidatus Hypogeohydataceae bacterium YC40]
MNIKPWDTKKKRFLHLFSSGASLEEIAQELKVSPKRLNKWRSLPGFQGALEEACKTLVTDEMPQLLRALTEKAKEGNVQAIKILFDYLGQSRGRSGADIGDLNEEERQRLREALLREIVRLGESPEGATSLEGPAQGGGGMG